MKDKERLELLENGSTFSSDDITFLLKQARLYQISRDETRRNCYEIRKKNNKLEQQNKRYREAIEKVLKIVKPNVLSSPECSDVEVVLRRALEGEE